MQTMAVAHSNCCSPGLPVHLDDVGSGFGLAGKDGAHSFVPRLERMRLPLKHVAVHVMAHERPGIFAARLMTDDRRDQIERYPHLRQHGRERSSKIMRSEYGDW